MNKKTFIFNIVLGALLALPLTAQAQSKPLFQLFSNEKQVAPVTTPAPAPVAPEVTEDTLDLNALKNQPISVRRKVVAGELDGIWVRLSSLFDKTKTATVRLGDNGVDITASIAKLDEAALSLAQARLSIDSLVAAANDPANETAVTLMVGTTTFKETVIKAEGELRATREAVIASLTALKAAVSAKVAPVQ